MGNEYTVFISTISGKIYIFFANAFSVNLLFHSIVFLPQLKKVIDYNISIAYILYLGDIHI